jgi:pimeloyl-ACP methyl ester carboxylesterase
MIPLPPAVDAPVIQFTSRAGDRLACYADASGSGRPLLLVHSINAAPSTYEVRPIFMHYQGRRPVYSLELPGFGLSERPDKDYTPELFAGAILDCLTEVVGGAADLLALSLSCEFAARARLARPDLIPSLALISPTGFMERQPLSPAIGLPMYRVLSAPLLGPGLYNLVASRPSIRYYLNKSFVTGAPAELIDYAWLTSHQPGAHHAPLKFLSMQLFTPDAPTALYGRLTDLPVLAVADRDPYISFERLPGFAAMHATWHYETLCPHLGLPHWERPGPTLERLDAFWAG